MQRVSAFVTIVGCVPRYVLIIISFVQVQAAMAAVEFGRGDMKEAQRAWRGINVVDQQMYLKDAYLKDHQLKWPPRVSN